MYHMYSFQQKLSLKLILIFCSFLLVTSGCGSKDKTGNESSSKSKGDVKLSQIEKDVIASLSDEGENNFKIQLRDDEQTKSGTEIYKSYGPIPYQVYFVRSQSEWKYKGRDLDVFRHLEVKYYKIDGEWILDKANVFNSWLSNVLNPINEETIDALIKDNTWQSFGHNNAEVESISPVKDFYTMPGIKNGIFYPTEFSSKQVKCMIDIVFTDGQKKKGRYEISIARNGVDDSWNRIISYRKIDENAI